MKILLVKLIQNNFKIFTISFILMALTVIAFNDANAIANNPPVPTAPDIMTAKNIDGVTIVSPNDPDGGDSHTFTITTQGANGNAVVDALGEVTYTPNTDFVGVDSFVITVTDSSLAEADVTIDVTVEASDVTAPTDGVLGISEGNSTVQLTWSDAVDDLTGIAEYKVVYAVSPDVLAVNCTDGNLIYSDTGNSITHSQSQNGVTYNYRLCAIDGYGNVSDGVTGSGTPLYGGGDGLSEPSFNLTGLPGIHRFDRGDDSNNLDSETNTNPITNIFYSFAVVLKDANVVDVSDIAIIGVFISTDDGANYYHFPLTCDGGDFSEGVLCRTYLNLGPAPSYKFYYGAVLADVAGTTYTSPVVYDGPVVELLNGYSMVGVPGDGGTLYGDDLTTATITNHNFSGGGLTGAALRYVAHKASLDHANYGEYLTIDANNDIYVDTTTAAAVVNTPLRTAEGVFVIKGAAMTTMEPALVTVEMSGDSFESPEPMSVGWNLITNPWGGPVKLSSLSLRNTATGKYIGWNNTAGEGIVVNAVYYYNGSDWGDTFSYQSAGSNPDAVLAPWSGYWIYMHSDSHKIVIPKP